MTNTCVLHWMLSRGEASLSRSDAVLAVAAGIDVQTHTLGRSLLESLRPLDASSPVPFTVIERALPFSGGEPEPCICDHLSVNTVIRPRVGIREPSSGRSM